MERLNEKVRASYRILIRTPAINCCKSSYTSHAITVRRQILWLEVTNIKLKVWVSGENVGFWWRELGVWRQRRMCSWRRAGSEVERKWRKVCLSYNSDFLLLLCLIHDVYRGRGSHPYQCCRHFLLLVKRSRTFASTKRISDTFLANLVAIVIVDAICSHTHHLHNIGAPRGN